jgi:WD40 repeat protein
VIAAAVEEGSNDPSGSEDKTGLIEFWNTGTGALDGAPIVLPNYSVPLLALSPDGHQVAAGAGAQDWSDWAIQRWDVDTRLPIEGPMSGHFAPVMALNYSRDGNYIASTSADRTVLIWDAHSGKPIIRLRGHGEMVTDVEFSGDDHRLATGSADGTVRIWKLPLPDSARTLGELPPLSTLARDL